MRLRSEGDPSLDASHASRRESARGSVPFACVGCEKAGGDEQAADKIDGDDKDGGGDWEGDSVGAVQHQKFTVDPEHSGGAGVCHEVHEHEDCSKDLICCRLFVE